MMTDIHQAKVIGKKKTDGDEDIYIHLGYIYLLKYE